MLNRCQIFGNLCADPEIRNVGGDRLVANLRLAVNEKWKDKNTGELREKSEYVTCVAWGGLAEIIDKLGVKKGERVYFEGKLQTRKWQDQSGNDRYSTEVVAQGFEGKFIACGGGGRSNDKESQDSQPELDDEIPF